ncbi:HPP family protein [Thiomicrorhabdus sp. Kp2]|uniref:CBS domain-containing protein n=1 Tax=Thiomicrorhabdus sp. Kp2 TaxID=1123518 RepID=UPI00041FE8DC|nr:CBS domain-containing protein [Thiomicrorhabdus sp. Kp2]
MFIVYSPEGQSFIGAVQNLPALKVDPAQRINKVEEAELDGLKVDIGHKDEQGKHQNSALNAYNENRSNAQRRIIVKVSEIMASPVFQVDANSSIENAWRLMEKHDIKHLPVIDNGELVGMCSEANLLGRMIISKSGELEGVKPELVRDVMQAGVVTTTLDTDIRHIAQALTKYQIDALVIMSEYQKILGIVTESDLISRLAKEPPIELYT